MCQKRRLNERESDEGRSEEIAIEETGSRGSRTAAAEGELAANRVAKAISVPRVMRTLWSRGIRMCQKVE